MKIGEVISRLDENQIYNILGISSSLVGCDGSSLLIHGVADLYEHWDKISCAVASFVFPCKFEHIVITGCPIPESLDEWYSVLYGITTKIDTNGVDHLNFIGKRIDFDNVETRGFNHSECSDMPTHLKLINNADVIFGTIDSDLLEPYIRLLNRFIAKYMVGVYVDDENKTDVYRIIKNNKLNTFGECNTNKGKIIFVGNIDKLFLKDV